VGGREVHLAAALVVASHNDIARILIARGLLLCGGRVKSRLSRSIIASLFRLCFPKTSSEMTRGVAYG